MSAKRRSWWDRNRHQIVGAFALQAAWIAVKMIVGGFFGDEARDTELALVGAVFLPVSIYALVQAWRGQQAVDDEPRRHRDELMARARAARASRLETAPKDRSE